MKENNETKRVFGDNPISRLNTFEKLTALKQPTRRDDSSKILTTPESIVRKHRTQVLRLESERPGRIMMTRPPRIPWHQKINWNFAINAGCLVALVAVAIYFAIRMVIPFLRMIRWQ